MNSHYLRIGAEMLVAIVLAIAIVMLAAAVFGHADGLPPQPSQACIVAAWQLGAHTGNREASDEAVNACIAYTRARAPYTLPKRSPPTQSCTLAALQLGYLTGRREVAYRATEACLAYTREHAVLPYER